MSFLLLDIAATELTSQEKEILEHPAVAGVILFKRNYENVKQITALCDSIHSVKENILVAVDQEGGRVQRFAEPLVKLPPLHTAGMILDQSNELRSVEFLRNFSWILAAELLSVHVDFSFAPVLDLFNPHSKVINERALHADPEIVARLGVVIVEQLRELGMQAVVKHFPGHGSVVADTHLSRAVDPRSRQEIFAHDLLPFRTAIKNQVAGIMIAHVIYPAIDDQPTGFSKIWLRDILRQELNYTGVIFSDDLSMTGAGEINTFERAGLALEAGCDVILVCNDPLAAIKVIDGFAHHHSKEVSKKLTSFKAKRFLDWQTLHRGPEWNERLQQLSQQQCEKERHCEEER